MGKIYQLEEELRDLCKDPQANGDSIYIKCKELVGRLLARNTSKIGPDVDRWTLDHEIATEITIRIVSGTLILQNWSGYIKCILPRMIKANVWANSPQILDSCQSNLDINKILEMNHSGSLSLVKKRNEYNLLIDMSNFPRVLDNWFNINIRYISKDSRIYHNIKISILLSLIRGSVCMYRLPLECRNQLIVYLNKLKLFISKTLMENQASSHYEEIFKISSLEGEEDFFD